MLVFSIEDENVKIFMNKILLGNVLDNYYVRLIEIESMAKFTIDCNISKNLCNWTEIKPFALNIIKGSQKPKRMKMIFSYDPEQLETFHSNASALFLNIHFEDGKVRGSTGTSQKTFSLEKDMDEKWSQHIIEFFRHNDIFISTHLD